MGSGRAYFQFPVHSCACMCILVFLLPVLLFYPSVDGGEHSNQQQQNSNQSDSNSNSSTDSVNLDRRCDLDSHVNAESVLELDLRGCNFQVVPAGIQRFTRLRKLDLSSNVLAALPLLPSSLEVLFLLGNVFESVPPAVSLLPALRMLSFKSCRLRDIHVPLPQSVVWLILTDNELERLPEQLGELTGMRKLMLANNQLTTLPSSMAGMRQLELLRLANNRLQQLPDWLFALPKLTWLAVAGNPAVAPARPRDSIADVALSDVAVGEKLGEGTSSVVYRARWRDQEVALKLYKAKLSSDGRNSDELRASCSLEHPNVVRVVGFFERPQLGAVLEWTAGMQALGNPPSLESITRDTYPPGTFFSGAFIRSVAASVATALAHVHSRGLAHGDLYAHNILVSPTGEAKLSDFGAAYFYGAGQPHASHHERMERRAFGFLLQELLERHDGSGLGMITEVRRLADACVADSLPPADGIHQDRKNTTSVCESFAGISASFAATG